jgi:lipopolysaccharide transport system permease protein
MDSISPDTLPRLIATVLDIGADSEFSHRDRQVMAATDVADGMKLWKLGFILAWLDIKLRYRGSVLGPFWLTISTGVMVGSMGAIYGVLFHMDLTTYMPFLALSLVLWNALNMLVLEACTAFTASESTIRSVRMPYFLHALRTVVRNIISLVHNVPVIVGVFLFFGVSPGAVAWLATPGFVLWLIDAFAACLLLGSFCARFRDIPPIVGSVIQIAFYVTPIMWKPDQLGSHGWWLPFNPFDALIEVVRAPLMGSAASAFTWTLAIGYSLVFCGVAWLLFSRVRGRLAYWM